ncbi:hypothetical protein BC831DRAFT_468626 [Entophlyctis helioformis]|nr:hypothetical protein BC831DRAFT_468626 [Entophlyctis helioformis]
MSSLWETVKKHARRMSAGGSSHGRPELFLDAARSGEGQHGQPIRIQLGESQLVYEPEQQQWRKESERTGGQRDLAERNRMLEGENQVLHFKVNVLLDMLAAAKLDVVQLQQLEQLRP